MKRNIILVLVLLSFCALISCSSKNTDITDSIEDDSLIKDFVIELLGEESKNVGIIYYDLTTNEKLSYNSNEIFRAASTYKVGLNILYYEYANKNIISLDNKLKYKDEFYEPGAGILQYEEDLNEVDIQTLLDLTLTHSDNIASNMLTENLDGGPNVRKELYDFFNIDMTVQENEITPEIAYIYLNYIYNNKEKENYKHMFETMKNNIYKDRIGKYIPKEIVYNKVGTYDTSIHDIAIVTDDNPFILIIYTKDLVEDVTVDCSKGEYFVSEIANNIYKYHLEKYSK